MLFPLMLSIAGIIFALIGSILLASHAFNRMITLREILDFDASQELSDISRRHELHQVSERKTITALIGMLRRVLTDMDVAAADSTRRANLGTFWLVLGVLLQGTALILMIMAAK